MAPPIMRRSPPLRLALPVLAVFLLLLFAACTPNNPQSTFDAAGPVAKDQRDLFLFIFWAAVAVFVVVEGLLIYAVIRYRRRPGQGTPRPVHGNRNLEIAWTIAPAIVLIIIAVPTIDVILETGNTPQECEEAGISEDCLRVNVIAHQWWWEFEYPDYGLVTANELHIPAGSVIDLSLDSGDVLHSFWVPKLAGKTDVVPRGDNSMWFQADEAGTFDGLCAEFCGISHAQMRFRVVAHPDPSKDISAEPCGYEPCPQEEFIDWVTAQRQEASTPGPGDDVAIRGERLFAIKGCVLCHTIRPLEAGGMQTSEGVTVKGPDLTHFASRGTLAAGILENTRESVRRWLQDPDDVKPGNLMSREAPVYNALISPLTAADIEELSLYLLSLK